MTIVSKRMMIHNYRGSEYLSTETFPSVSECAKALRRKGYRFKRMRICGLDDDSEIIRKGDDWVEVEEMRDEDRWLLVDGKAYLPLSDWVKRYGTTVRKARYAYSQGRVSGMKVGRGNFLYLEVSDEG